MFKLLLILLVLSFGSTIIAQNNTNHSDIAKDFFESLNKKDFEKVHSYFSDELKTKAPLAALPTLRQQIFGSFGELVKIIEARDISASQTLLKCEFEKSFVAFSVVFDSENKIAGFTVAEAQEKNTAKYETPSYANPASFEETEVTVGAGEWALPSTLTMPKGKTNVPAIVLVHGSGPNDRDETHINPANKIFKDLAWGLATKGIAVLRYEKRTRAHGRKMSPNLTVNEETVDDAVLAVELLRKTPNVDTKQIYVLGHSLGGMMIPRVGQRNKNIAGFVVFAGTARPLEDVIIEQYEYLTSLDGNMSPEEKEFVENGKKDFALVKSLQPNSAKGKTLLGLTDYYWLDLKNYNPPMVAKTLKQPMLVLQGESDYQVTMKDFANWKNALGKRKNVVFKTYPNLTHSFMDSLGGKPSPKDYDAVSHVKEIVIADIASWILKTAKK